MPLFEVDAERPVLVQPPQPAGAFGTDAQRVVDGNIEGLLGEQIFPDNWAGVFALAICSQLIGQGMLVYALGHVPPLIVGVALLTQPALSALLGWIYYGETLTARDLVGAALIEQFEPVVDRSYR